MMALSACPKKAGPDLFGKAPTLPGTFRVWAEFGPHANYKEKEMELRDE
jgi:hypothetical protein